MLKSLFNDFLEDLAKDAVKLINKFLVDLMDIALNCQNYISTKHLIKGLSLSKVNAVILKYAIALLILKFVQKGFSIYILQSDGDPVLNSGNSSPTCNRLLSGGCNFSYIFRIIYTTCQYFRNLYKSNINGDWK